MIIEDIKLYRYHLPFKIPLTWRKKTIANRDGLIIAATTTDGLTGYGDIAPLPGSSPETLTEAKDTIFKIRGLVCGEEVPSGLEKLNGDFSEWLSSCPLPSSVKFGFETAILSLLAQRRKIPLSNLLGGPAHHMVDVSSLLTGTTKEVMEQAKERLTSGYRSFELSVGGQALADDIKRVKAVSEVLWGKALLRLSADKAWTLKQATDFFDQVGMDVVEYIEEPLKKTQDLAEFYQRTLIPVALNESIREDGLDKFLSVDGVEVVVIKPTLCGGIERSWSIIQRATQMGVKVILSSSFESGVGIVTLVQLSACCCQHVAVNLDTARYFCSDVLVDSPLANSGQLNVDDFSSVEINLRRDLLEEVLP